MSRLTTLIDNRLAFAIFLCVCLLNPLLAHANEWEQADKAIYNLSAEIRMNDGAVGQTLMEAMQSNHGDLQKWHALDEKMNALGKSLDSNLPEIGRNLALLRANNLDTSAPVITLRPIFEGNLNMLRAKQKNLLDLAKVENEKINVTAKRIDETRKALIRATSGAFVEAVEIIVPSSELELIAEGTVAILTIFGGPVAWTVAISGKIIKDSIEFSIASKSLADQAKALNELLQSLLDRKALFEKNLATLMKGARELEQIEKILDKHEKKLTELKAKINAAAEGWNNQQKNAFEERKKVLEEEIRKLASQPLSGGKWTLCNGSVVSLSPGEYSGEVSSMLSQLESYTRAVEDGGDPDNFLAMVMDWNNKLSDQYKPKSEDNKLKREAYSSALTACIQSLLACTRSANTHDKWLACYSMYCGCLLPSSAALANSDKELSRIFSIHYSIRNFYSFFQERVEVATRSRTREFWNTYSLWEEKFGAVSSKAYEAVSGVPYWDGIWMESSAKKLDEQIQSILQWGSSIADIRNFLLSTAVQLKELDKSVKDSAKKYEEVNLERIRIANQAQDELTSLLNKWGRLIGYYWGFYLPWISDRQTEFTPRSPEQEKNVSSLLERIRGSFAVKEPDHLKRAKTIDFLGIAALYENKANELTFYTDWAETYRYRLFAAVGALNRISREKTDQGFYAAREGNAQEVLNREFSKPPWSTIASDAEKYVSKGDYASLPWAGIQSWDNIGVWQKLYAGQTILLNKLNKEAPHYIRARSNGWFQPVPPDIIDPLQENWKKLREVCERYDALAKPERDKIGDGQEKVQKEAQLVFETWGKMPEHSRKLVRDEHSRFSNAYNWLYSYLRIKPDALRPSLQPPTNSVAIQLDDLILGYAPAYEKWKKQQEEAERRAEEQRLQWEAAEKARLEEERKKAEEERKKAEEEQNKAATNLALVQNLYNQFKAAYESRNDSQVMSFISDSWEAGDGTTLADLQMNLSRSFRTFDEIRYDIQNLKIDALQDGRYSVGYDVVITSRIFRRNIKHEEKSSVREEVITDNSGKVKIFRTGAGRFWHTQ